MTVTNCLDLLRGNTLYSSTFFFCDDSDEPSSDGCFHLTAPPPPNSAVHMLGQFHALDLPREIDIRQLREPTVELYFTLHKRYDHLQHLPTALETRLPET